MVPRRLNRTVPPPTDCPLNQCMGILGAAWTAHIIWYLSSAPRRFSELKHDIPGISSKVLTQRLRSLTEDGIIIRREMPTSPPTVEYELTELGAELKPAIEVIVQVGERIKALQNAAPTEEMSATSAEPAVALRAV